MRVDCPATRKAMAAQRRKACVEWLELHDRNRIMDIVSIPTLPGKSLVYQLDRRKNQYAFVGADKPQWLELSQMRQMLETLRDDPHAIDEQLFGVTQ